MNNINEIKNSQLCYGCGTCNVVCNKDAITMQYDNIGRLQPIIDDAKCVNCGLCSKICPSLDQKEYNCQNQRTAMSVMLLIHILAWLRTSKYSVTPKAEVW